MAGSEIFEGFLVARGGREERPILAGLAVLPRDLAMHLRAFGNVYERMPIGDSRVVRFVLGQTGRRDFDLVPFAEVVARYGDLVPADLVEEPAPLAAEDALLAQLLAMTGGVDAPALDLGCGVGRGAFVLREYGPRALGVDRSVARVRRARNVATTRADFFLPPAASASGTEVPLELGRLSREGVDFMVADVESLPFADAVFGLVLLRDGDGRGEWTDAGAAAAEAVRVLAEGGLLVTEGVVAPASPVADDFRTVAEAGEFRAWKRR